MFSFTVLLGIGTFITVCSCLCQNGWTRFNDSCYLIGYGQHLTFVEAENYCTQHNGHLIHVNTAEENVFIVDILHKTKASSSWVGISDMDAEGLWQWYGTSQKPEFTYWYPGQPGGGQPEDCGVYTAHHPDYKWDDYSCDHHFQPICESSTNVVDSIIGK
ncbi:C-type lectin domain family 10 member A-like isoform X2 [Ruditapes philippinarum]|uniref:C-type lectin domain family 10 member A-like isoform X2 n=1 Tax=Ruditapes philippinarum TaxID=129788 RepID=UPI00295A59B3|nr:C-type lectin domain family 10 member A-like isoform X2 [Ruditapes philippinarum]